MTERLSEVDCRRPDFIGGVAVTMIDGNEWQLAEPRIRLVPTDGDIGFEVCLSLDDNGKFNTLASRYNELSTMSPTEFQEHAFEYGSLQIRLARLMLERNYNLSLDQLRLILQFSTDPKDEVAFALRESVALVLAGRSPKPLAVGVESVPSPTA